MSLADEVRTLRQRVAQRLAELEPLVREYEQLREVADELGLEPSDYAEAAAEGAGPAAPATEPRPAKAGAPRTRAKGRGARSGAAGSNHVPQLLEVVRENPGATVAEIASIMDVPPTSLYRAVRDLTGTGEIVKRGRALFPSSTIDDGQAPATGLPTGFGGLAASRAAAALPRYGSMTE